MMFEDRKIQDPIRSCPRCSEAIVWMRTYSGKKVPVVYSESTKYDHIFDRTKHTFHTCKKKDKS